MMDMVLLLLVKPAGAGVFTRRMRGEPGPTRRATYAVTVDPVTDA